MLVCKYGNSPTAIGRLSSCVYRFTKLPSLCPSFVLRRSNCQSINRSFMWHNRHLVSKYSSDSQVVWVQSGPAMCHNSRLWPTVSTIWTWQMWLFRVIGNREELLKGSSMILTLHFSPDSQWIDCLKVHKFMIHKSLVCIFCTLTLSVSQLSSSLLCSKF